MFDLPTLIPKQIIEQVDLAFAHYFYDNNTCANKIRTSIELILDDIKAPKKRLKNGKLKLIPNLHQRIAHYSKTKRKLCELLLALKIIGNKGSHNHKSETKDILDAFEILELVLDKIYIKTTERIESLAKDKLRR